MGEINESLNVNLGALDAQLRAADQKVKKIETEIAAAQRLADQKLQATVARIKAESVHANHLGDQFGHVAEHLAGSRVVKRFGQSLAPLLEAELGIPGIGHGLLHVGHQFSHGAAAGFAGLAGGAVLAGAFILKEVFDEYRREDDQRFSALRAHLLQFEQRQKDLELQIEREQIQHERDLRKADELTRIEARIDARDKIEDERLAYVADFGDY